MAEEIEKKNTETKSDDDQDAGFSDEQLDTVAGGGFIKSDDRDARHPAKLEIPNLKVTFSAADAE